MAARVLDTGTHPTKLSGSSIVDRAEVDPAGDENPREERKRLASRSSFPLGSSAYFILVAVVYAGQIFVSHVTFLAVLGGSPVLPSTQNIITIHVGQRHGKRAACHGNLSRRSRR